MTHHDIYNSVLLCDPFQFLFEEVYIDVPGNEEWFEKYRYDIPIVHLNGEYVMKHRINERLLSKKLGILKH